MQSAERDTANGIKSSPLRSNSKSYNYLKVNLPEGPSETDSLKTLKFPVNNERKGRQKGKSYFST